MKRQIKAADIKRIEKELKEELKKNGYTKHAIFLEATLNVYKGTK